MNGPFQIYQGDQPLTVPIEDERRATLGYNMMYAMAKKEVMFQIDGNEQPLDTNRLQVLNGEGKLVALDLDAEWFGTPDQNQQVKNAVLDNIMEAMIQDGAEPDRNCEESMMEQYTVCAYDEDNCRVRFAPKVWDFDKAGEMQNFMVHGVDPSVSFSGMNFRDQKVDFKEFYIVNEDGDVYEDQLDENWARGFMKAEDAGQDFAAALAALPTLDGDHTMDF